MKNSKLGEVEKIVDLDGGNSWVCSVCKLPIFSTPYYRDADEFMHDECAKLPEELTGSVAHPWGPLFRRKRGHRWVPCEHCRGPCETELYECVDCCCRCGKFYDMFCASTIKILHRSHQHRLIASRARALSSRLICAVCGTQHIDRALSRSDVSYLCSLCGFWIHPDCALLPNAIVQQYTKHQHQHPLLLGYREWPDDRNPRYCAICEGPIESVGSYSCTGCPSYYVHIMCAVSDPRSFKPVFIQEARFPDLVHLPIPDDHTSAIHYLIDNTTSSDDGLLPLDQLHEHPLILHEDNDGDHHDLCRECNACAQLITSSPFRSCSECPDFFLHECCVHLPRTLTQHPAHKRHPLSLVPKLNGGKIFKSIVGRTNCCYRPTNGFTYSCKDCNFYMDVLCASIPTSITHDAHSDTHILYPSFMPYFIFAQWDCACCGELLLGYFYKCRTCENFGLHSRCAVLPNTISHRFDQHPIKLISKTNTSKPSESSSSSSSGSDLDVLVSSSSKHLQVLYCEICENDIDSRLWYYSCDECDHSFHIKCIPSLHKLSKIKLRGNNIRVESHNCPLSLIRELTVCGYRCGCCGETFKKDSDGLAVECSDCDFRLHTHCALTNVKEDVD